MYVVVKKTIQVMKKIVQSKYNYNNVISDFSEIAKLLKTIQLKFNCNNLISDLSEIAKLIYW